MVKPLTGWNARGKFIPACGRDMCRVISLPAVSTVAFANLVRLSIQFSEGVCCEKLRHGHRFQDGRRHPGRGSLRRVASSSRSLSHAPVDFRVSPTAPCSLAQLALLDRRERPSSGWRSRFAHLSSAQTTSVFCLSPSLRRRASSADVRGHPDGCRRQRNRNERATCSPPQSQWAPD